MSRITDRMDLGYFPLQDHAGRTDGTPQHLRNNIAAVRISKLPDRNIAGSAAEFGRDRQLGTMGDIHPWSFWQTRDRTQRGTGAWSQIFPAIVSSGDFNYGATSLLPLRKNWESDNRFHQRNLGPASGMPWQVQGQLLSVHGGMDEDRQHMHAMHADPRLVCPNVSGPGEAGALLVDLQPAGEMCMADSRTPGIGGRHARIQSLMRVISLSRGGSFGALGGGINTVALNFAYSGADAIPNFGAFFAPMDSMQRSPPKRGPNTGDGGPITGQSRIGGDNSGGGGVGGDPFGDPTNGDPREDIKKPKDFGVWRPSARIGHGIGLMSAMGAYGPIHAGNLRDKHQHAADDDGHPVNSGHISTNAYYYADNFYDAPLFFERMLYPKASGFPNTAQVHLCFDERAAHPFTTGAQQGYWRWFAEVPDFSPDDGGGGGDDDDGGGGGDDDNPDGPTTPGGGTPRRPGGPRGPTTPSGGGGPNTGGGRGNGPTTGGGGTEDDEDEDNDKGKDEPYTGGGGKPYPWPGPSFPLAPGFPWTTGDEDTVGDEPIPKRPAPGPTTPSGGGGGGGGGSGRGGSGGDSDDPGGKTYPGDGGSGGGEGGGTGGDDPGDKGPTTPGGKGPGLCTEDDVADKDFDSNPNKLAQSSAFVGGRTPWYSRKQGGGDQSLVDRRSSYNDISIGTRGRDFREALGSWSGRNPHNRSRRDQTFGLKDTVGTQSTADRGTYTMQRNLMSGFAAINFRPQLWVNGYPNFERNSQMPPGMTVRDERFRPQSLVMRSWGLQAEGDWDYTQRPYDSRARGGTVSGGVMVTLPRFVGEDFAQIGAYLDVEDTTDSTQTEGHVLFTPGTRLSFGTPVYEGTSPVDANAIEFWRDTSSNDYAMVGEVAGTEFLRAYEDSTDDALIVQLGTGGTGAIVIPSGTTDQRPDNPQDGMLRINTTLGVLEYYYSGSWNSVAT